METIDVQVPRVSGWRLCSLIGFLLIGYLCLALYISAQAVLITFGDNNVAPVVKTVKHLDALWVGVFISGVLSFATVLYPMRVTGRALLSPIGPLYPFYVSVSVLIAWRCGVLLTFTTSFTLTLCIIYIIDLAGRRGLVHYTYERVDFVASRCTTYAIGSAIARLSVTQDALPPRAARLLWFGIATIETAAMLLFKSESYTFSVSSTAFAAYALIKSSMFLVVPILEEVLLDGTDL